MTVYELKTKYLEHHPNGHFFDRNTLKFFGETLSTMRVLAGFYSVKDYSGNEHKAYCLSSYQRNYPGGPRRHLSYFDAETFEHIMM